MADNQGVFNIQERVFIVEDDRTYARFLDIMLKGYPNIETHVFHSGNEALHHLHLKPSIVTLDYSLPDLSGAEVLRKFLEHNEACSVVILSGQSDISTAIALLKDGAEDYIPKGENTRDLLHNTLDKILRRHALEDEVASLRSEMVMRYQPSSAIIGKSKATQGVLALLDKAAKSEIPVSIVGETGTGKELCAKTIHYQSRRNEGQFVSVNISAIPPEQLEYEFFGHEKDAFPEAMTRKEGCLEQAAGGTLYLSEISELPRTVQARLLQVLQEGHFTRKGGQEVLHNDFRLIVSSAKDLSEEVGKGNFREDLFYCLLGLPIRLPPLRERGDDVIILARHFLQQANATGETQDALTLDSEAKEKLLHYPFPGNVRELKAIIELAAVMAESATIQANDIKFQRSRRVEDLLSEELTLREYTRRIVKYYLDRYDNNVVEVSEKLDIGKSTIYRMIKTGEIQQ